MRSFLHWLRRSRESLTAWVWRATVRRMNSDDYLFGENEYLDELVSVCRTNAIVRQSLSHRGRETVNQWLTSRGEAPLFTIQSPKVLVEQLVTDCEMKWIAERLRHPKGGS